MKEQTTIFKVIDRSAASCLGKVFMECYKRGVGDAYLHSNDEGMLREHVESTRDFLKFGFVGNLTGSWIYWRNRLTDIADAKRCYKVMETYWNRMGKYQSNYLSVAMIMAQTFYNRGIMDYLDNPGADNAAVFAGEDVVRWWGDRKKIDGHRLRAYVQDVCAEITDRIDNGEENVLKRSHYEFFMQSFSFAITARK